MALFRVKALPKAALAAASQFHAELLPAINPTQDDEDLIVVFPPADHTHHAWRLAVVQSLAREHAPLRVNAIESDDEAAIAAAQAYLAKAPGLTGQVLRLDSLGAPSVI